MRVVFVLTPSVVIGVIYQLHRDGMEANNPAHVVDACSISRCFQPPNVGTQ